MHRTADSGQARSGRLEPPSPEPFAFAAPHADGVPGLVWAYVFDEVGHGRPVPGAAPLDLDAATGFHWLHFDLLDQRVGDWCAAKELFPPKARQAFVQSDYRLRVEYRGDLIWGVFADIRHGFDAVTDLPAQLHFVMSAKLLVTGRRQPLHGVLLAREKADEGSAFSCPCEVLETIADCFLDDVHALAEALEQELDSVEDHVLGHGRSDESLAPMRHKLARHARQLSRFSGVLHRFAGWSEKAELPRDTHAAATRIVHRADTLSHDLQAMQDRARLLQEEAAENRAREMNRHLYVLTVLTAFLLPPTLIVGLFGMNTGGLPFSASPHGFWFALFCAGASSAAIYFMLRRLRR